MSTTLEALVTGMIWGAIGRRVTGWAVTVPSYGTDALRGELVIRTPEGAELLITVTETRGPTK